MSSVGPAKLYEDLFFTALARFRDEEGLGQRKKGWQNYFRYGTVAKAYQGVNLYVYDRVRHFLRRRHKAPSSKGSAQFPITVVFGRLGVHRMSTARR